MGRTRRKARGRWSQVARRPSDHAYRTRRIRRQRAAMRMDIRFWLFRRVDAWRETLGAPDDGRRAPVGLIAPPAFYIHTSFADALICSWPGLGLGITSFSLRSNSHAKANVRTVIPRKPRMDSDSGDLIMRG